MIELNLKKYRERNNEKLEKIRKKRKKYSLLGIEPGSPGTESRVLTITPQN